MRLRLKMLQFRSVLQAYWLMIRMLMEINSVSLVLVVSKVGRL
jgi:hypothetical protein